MGGKPADKCKSEALFFTLNANNWVISTRSLSGLVRYQVIMTMIATQLQTVQTRIRGACDLCARSPSEVTLLAVSKTFDAAAVREAYAAGLTAFGENYIQEAVEKIAHLRDLPLQWHMIGPVQSNKSRLVAEQFDWVHTVDRLKLAQRLSAQRPAHLPPLQVCLQVNVDGGANKSGVTPSELLPLAQQVATLPGLRLRGLMAIPEPAATYAAQFAVHQLTHGLFNELRAAGLPLDTLSMGMSGDLEAAIAAGATMVRIGTALFGAR